jgi:hypothetical protein
MDIFWMKEKSKFRALSLLLTCLLLPLLLLGCGQSIKSSNQESKKSETADKGAVNNGTSTSSSQASTLFTSPAPTTEPAAAENLRWGFIDKTGKLVIKPMFERVGTFSEGLAAAQVYGLWGFIDTTGKWVIKYQYDAVGSFKGGLAGVMAGNKWGFINKTGNMQIDPGFASIHDFSEHKAAIKKGSSWGFIDERGGMIINSKYDDAGSFSEGVAAVKVKDKWGYIDVMDKFLIEPKYVMAGPFIDSLARVTLAPDPQLGVQEAIIDKRAMERVVTPLEQRENFSDGLALFQRHNKWGYVDSTGQMAIKARYIWADRFSENLACVKKDFKKGYIDTQGKMVIEPQFEDGHAFTEGLAGVLLKTNLSEPEPPPTRQ